MASEESKTYKGVDIEESLKRLERDGNIIVGSVDANGKVTQNLLCDCGFAVYGLPSVEECGKRYKEHCGVAHPDRQVLDFQPARDRLS